MKIRCLSISSVRFVVLGGTEEGTLNELEDAFWH